jgi:glycosyltransferase involved in cell wall biosynthesis
MNRSLRILVAHNAPARRTGGMSRIMGLIHDNLLQAGHTVDYFCADDIPPGCSGRLARFAFPVLIVRRARQAAREGRPYDIVNVHEPNGAFITLARRLAGSPRIVVTSHGVEQRAWERRLDRAGTPSERPSLTSRLFYPTTVLSQARLALRNADHIFCLNMEDREYLINRFAVESHKITRIYPAADPIYGDAAARRDYSRAATLVFPGTWIRRKGTEDVVQAFPRLLTQFPNLKLVVLNGGVAEASVRACFPNEVRGSVSCVSADPENGTAAALGASDIYLLPSLFEGTPLTLMEAMWSGLPIVTTATCGMRDVIEDGSNGLLVPIRSPESIFSALRRLLSDSALRAKLGQMAHRQAHEKYTWDRVAKPIREVYEHLSADSLAATSRPTDQAAVL